MELLQALPGLDGAHKAKPEHRCVVYWRQTQSTLWGRNRTSFFPLTWFHSPAVSAEAVSCVFPPQAEAEAAAVHPQHVAHSSQEHLATLQQDR